MARNQEKAQSMLNRFLAYKQELRTGYNPNTRRPRSSAGSGTIQECERWRMQLVKEITNKIFTIQNGEIKHKMKKTKMRIFAESLGEQRIRDLNDEINRLMREKANWERRIIELGGANYRV
jgi:pre-mRNA-splicing factor ISY1